MKVETVRLRTSYVFSGKIALLGRVVELNNFVSFIQDTVLCVFLLEHENACSEFRANRMNDKFDLWNVKVMSFKFITEMTLCRPKC